MSNENCAIWTLPKGYLRTGMAEPGRADTDRAGSTLGGNPKPGRPYYLRDLWGEPGVRTEPPGQDRLHLVVVSDVTDLLQRPEATPRKPACISP